MSILFSRHLSSKMNIALRDTPVVMVIGPRQCGKTTLVQHYSGGMSYFTLDDDNVLNAVLNDPVGFVRQVDRAVIDEIQHAPELLRAIKLSIDRDRKPGRFLLTGSANLLALPRIADSLAGRMEILTLLPLSNSEIERRENFFLRAAETNRWPDFQIKKKFDLFERVLTGGYPEMITRSEFSRRRAWAHSYLKALMERDIRDVAAIDKLNELPHLLAVLAQFSGQLINFSQIGGQLQLDSKTVQKYIGLLENIFLVKKVLPWTHNELSRLIKTPKLHFIDAGLQAAMARLTLENTLLNKTRVGATLESWVYGELAKAISLEDDMWQIFHYRDKDQVEIDFILENSAREIIAIEVKCAETIMAQDFRSLEKLRNLMGKRWLNGIVLYNGTQVLSFGKGLMAVPLDFL